MAKTSKELKETKNTKAPVKKVAKKAPAKKAPAKKVAVKKVAAKKTTKSTAGAKTSKPKSTEVKAKTEVKVKTKKTEVSQKLNKINEGELLALTVAQGMFEKKAENIRILDLRNVQGASTDYFVISHATNDKQVEAIARSLEEEVKKNLKQTPWHREGFENLHWVLVDYIDVVAHIFLEEKRDFYDIESLWGDAKVVPFKGK